jgi:hypothetical protein
MVIVSLFLIFSLLFVFLSFHQNQIKDISSVLLKFEISLPAVEHFSSYKDFTLYKNDSGIQILRYHTAYHGSGDYPPSCAAAAAVAHMLQNRRWKRPLP